MTPSLEPSGCDSPNIGIKHGFPCVNVCQVPREMLKTEAEVFNNSRGTWQALMHWKTMFDCCYCINSTTMLKKITKTAGHYFRPHRNYLADSYTHYPCLLKSLFQAMVVYHHFSNRLQYFHKFKLYSLTFPSIQCRLLCHFHNIRICITLT